MGATWIRSVNAGVVVRRPPGELWQAVPPRGANLKAVNTLAVMARQDRGGLPWSRIPELPRMRAELQLKPGNSRN